MYPNDKEIIDYNIIPNTLTKANEAFGGLNPNRVYQLTPDRYQQYELRNEPVYWAEIEGHSWQLPKTHPRNNKTICLHTSQQAGIQTSLFYEEERKSIETFFIMKMKKAFIHDSGFVMMDCGYVQLHEGCELIFRFLGRNFNKRCRINMINHKNYGKTLHWSDLFLSIKNETYINETNNDFRKRCITDPTHVKPITRHDKVFVITANWDNNYHHFLMDSVTRLIRHLDFLKDNPDIKIHIRSFEQYAKKERYIVGGIATRNRILDLLDIPLSRIISGPVLANEVYLPKAPPCNRVLFQPYEIRYMTNILIEKAAAKMKTRKDTTRLESKKPYMVILDRPCATKEDCLKTWREWDRTTFQEVLHAFKSKFAGTHEVIVMSPDDKDMVDCLACQIEIYKKTDLLIGLHGAGITNLMFMKPNSVLIEMVGQFDGRMAPVCGYHGPFAQLFGIHHYIHYWYWKGNELLVYNDVADAAYKFYHEVKKQ